MTTEKIALERYKYDVLVIGAGGAGLRAAVEARESGLRVAIICKSLFGKAHTVMAEGGAAADEPLRPGQWRTLDSGRRSRP